MYVIRENHSFDHVGRGSSSRSVSEELRPDIKTEHTQRKEKAKLAGSSVVVVAGFLS